METCFVWLSSKTCSLNYYFIPHITIFKSLGDLSFGCFSDNISTLCPSLTPLLAHLVFIKHLKPIPMSGPLDLLFPGPGKLFPYISVEDLVLHSIQFLIIFLPLITIYKTAALSFLYPFSGLFCL